MPCLCGDSQCPSCGSAQGTLERSSLQIALDLGFTCLDYKAQRVAFQQAIALGWKGKCPSVLGHATAEAALHSALKHLECIQHLAIYGRTTYDNQT